MSIRVTAIEILETEVDRPDPRLRRVRADAVRGRITYEHGGESACPMCKADLMRIEPADIVMEGVWVYLENPPTSTRLREWVRLDALICQRHGALPVDP